VTRPQDEEDRPRPQDEENRQQSQAPQHPPAVPGRPASGYPAADQASAAQQPASPVPRTGQPPVQQVHAPSAAQQAKPAQAQAPTAESATVARPATQAAVAAAAAAATPARAQPLAAPDAAGQGPPGTVYDGGPPPGPNGNGHGGVSGRLARLRIGWHTLSRPALAQMRISAPGTGLILGSDRQQKPVAVRMFRPESTRVTLVGGAWAGQLVAFRALALGARVALVAADPQAWHGFGERATGRSDRLTVLGAEQPLALAATPQQPVLVVYDLGVVGAATPQPLGPWQTQLTVLRRLDQPGVPAIQDCNLVILQRLAGAEAAQAGGALKLPSNSTQFLQVMAEDMVALVGDGTLRYISLAQTDIEHQHLGAPRR